MQYLSSAETDKGLRRRANEDAILPSLEIPWLGGENCLVFAVADGVGGQVAGALASATAIEAFRQAFVVAQIENPADRLRAAITSANLAVSSRAAASQELQGMATTFVAAAIRGGRIWFANVGDSRGYLLQDDVLYQVTRDHSVVSDAVRAGVVAPEEAPFRPERHVINRSLGMTEYADVDSFGPLRFGPGDRALVCSDGLHDAISDEEIVEVLHQHAGDQVAPWLVAAANNAGGPDNVSVVVVSGA